MKKLIGLVPVLVLSLFTSCASNQIQTIDGVTYARVPAQAQVLKHGYNVLKGGEAKKLDEAFALINSSKQAKREILGNANAADITNLKQIEDNPFARRAFMNNLEQNQGIFKIGGKSVRLADSWKQLEDASNIFHKNIIPNSQTAKARAAQYKKAGTVAFTPVNRKVPGSSLYNKRIDSALAMGIITSKEANNYTAAFSKVMKETNYKDANLHIQNLELDMMARHAFAESNTDYKAIGFLDAAGICGVFKATEEGIVLNQLGQRVDVLLKEQGVPKTLEEWNQLKAVAGQNIINKREVAWHNLSADDQVKVLDEWRWREEGLNKAPCKALH